ncbi:hypothetical protein EBR43_13235 [bacterium]|nr:hypothetical protein [bacterium]
MNALIDELYDPDDCKRIRDFYKGDNSLHTALRQAIGEQITIKSDKFLNSNPVDIVCLVCLTAKFASSEDECHRVAITVCQMLDEHDPLPYLHKDDPLTLASKTLISLSFFYKALEHRFSCHGAPSPTFYRNISKSVYKSNKQPDIAAHHEKWEGFLGEMFC